MSRRHSALLAILSLPNRIRLKGGGGGDQKSPTLFSSRLRKTVCRGQNIRWRKDLDGGG